MRVARVLGWLLLALAVMAAGAEALHALEVGAAEWMPMGLLWYRLAPDSLNLMQAVVQRHLWPALWDPGIVFVLNMPASAVLGALGLVLCLAGGRGDPDGAPRRRRRRFAAR